MDSHPLKLMAFSHICSANRITGAEKFLLFLLKELRKVYACTLVVPSAGVLADFAAESGIKVEILPIPLLWSLYKPESNVKEDISLFKHLYDIAPLIDLMHLCEPDFVITNTCINLAPALAAKEMHIPVGWIVNEVIPLTPYGYAAAEEIAQHADLLIGCSRTTLLPFKGIHIPKHVLYPSFYKEDVIPSRWNIERSTGRSILGITDDEHVNIGIIATDLVTQKGVQDFTEMALLLCPVNPNVHFSFIGNPFEQDDVFHRMVARIQQHGYSSQFHHFPFTKHIGSVYPALDIVVVPSLVPEGFGLIALEGMLFEKPVLCYRSGGLLEQVTPTNNLEWSVEPGDVAGLARIAQKLIDDKPKRIARGVLNRKLAMKSFGIEAFRTRLIPIMNAIRQSYQTSANRARSSLYRFPNGILIKGARSHKVFLLENGTKRPIQNLEAFSLYRYNFHDVIPVLDYELRQYPTGKSIGASVDLDSSPKQFLAKGSGYTIYWIKDMIRYPFASEAVFHRLRFNMANVLELPDSLIESLPIGYALNDDCLLNHGLLPYKYYRNSRSEVYYMDEVKLRRITHYAEVAFFGHSDEDFIDLQGGEFKILKSHLK
ncbi:glycosyltransferase family 4 protein [Paenibacillus sp. UNC451MF]|uniref:glycosyltransferase family 4 protein n=1 Tax=Paenibacillus sp. UNC451MF TaxID=1449063 RepID=UPI00048F5C5E|nr:glycosyltransferase family 4 protein [Paenibacillus sp. UNC451MF]